MAQDCTTGTLTLLPMLKRTLGADWVQTTFCQHAVQGQCTVQVHIGCNISMLRTHTVQTQHAVHTPLVQTSICCTRALCTHWLQTAACYAHTHCCKLCVAVHLHTRCKLSIHARYKCCACTQCAHWVHTLHTVHTRTV
jgi:hypothetical protein